MASGVNDTNQLTAADVLNLTEILTYKNKYGEHVQFLALLKAYGRWGIAGILPRALQCTGNDSPRSYAVSDSMMLKIEQHVSALRKSLSEARDLYLAFKLEYLTPPSGEEYRAVLQRYKDAVHERSKLYSVRGRQRDATAFIKRLRKSVMDDIKNL